MSWIESLLDTFKNRLRTPILGAFIFSWMIVNSQFVLTLLFGSTAVKEQAILVREFNLLYSIIFPSLLSLVYIFAVPYIQFLVDILMKTIDEKRTKFRSTKNIGEYQLRENEIRQKVLVDEQYQIKLRDENLVFWVDTKQELQNKIDELKQQLKTKNQAFEKAEELTRSMSDSQASIMVSCQELRIQLKEIHQEMENYDVIFSGIAVDPSIPTLPAMKSKLLEKLSDNRPERISFGREDVTENHAYYEQFIDESFNELQSNTTELNRRRAQKLQEFADKQANAVGSLELIIEGLRGEINREIEDFQAVESTIEEAY